MKRGQLTILLIIAVLIGISALFAWYLLDLATPDSKPDSIQQGDTKTETRICLEQAGTQAVMYALAHGGVNEDYWLERENIAVQDIGSKTRLAYTEGTPTTVETGESAQRGLEQSNDPWAQQEYLMVDNAPVRFWIFRGPDTINYWPTVTEQEFAEGTPQSGPYLGKLRTEPLCAQRGFNRPGADLDGANSCIPGTYKVLNNPELSWQEALEQRITTIVSEDELCDLPSPVTLALGEDDVTLISGNESVTVDIRLKRMYNLAFNLAKYEMTDPEFNPTSINGSLQVRDVNKIAITGCEDRRFGNDCAIPGLVVTTRSVDDPFEHFDEDTDQGAYPWNNYLADSLFEPYNDAWRQNATVISITDTTTVIDNQNPTLRFAIKNRYPIATGVQTDEATIVFTAADPDGVPVYVSCYESTSSPIVPECTGTIDRDRLSTTPWPFEKTTYCANNGTATELQVQYVLCSDSARPVPGMRKIIPDWLSLIGLGNTDATAGPLGAVDALPRNCRLATTNVTVTCS